VRVPGDVATRLRAGHPLVFREALGGRPMREGPGDLIDVLDPAGELVARGLFDPSGPVALRVFSRDPREGIDGEALARRVEGARRLRERLGVFEASSAHRLIHGEGDGVPAISVDRYGDFLVSILYSAAAEVLAAPLYDALEAAYHPTAIYEQTRYRPQSGEGPRTPAQLKRGSAAPVELEVVEHGARFLVDVTAPLSTGLFPDLREGRRAVAERSRGARVLNLFSYTGAFSVYAARGGAAHVVSVDLAQKAHARARRNFALNGLDEAAHELIAGDAFKVLARLADRGRKFDLIVLDPPSFGQSKERAFSVSRDYRELVEGALAVAAPAALVACVSNTHKLTPDEHDRAIGEAAVRAGRYVRVVERRGLPADFPVPAGYLDGHYLKFSLCAAS
jgi:23S rRNA (cytosine1962-C5)-methyltransferase